MAGIDLSVAGPAVVVTVASKPTLVYELHVTNFSAVAVALSRAQVLSGESAGPAIADYRGDSLRTMLGRPGLSRDYRERNVIGPGMRAVLFFWVEMPPGVSARAAVRHLIDIEVLMPEGAIKSTVEGGVAWVSAEAPVALAPPLRGGPWVAIYDPLLIGGHRTAIYAVNGRARIPGRFAIDWVQLTASGTLETSETHSKTWNGYGTDVLAVADGRIAAVMDDMPDNSDRPAPLPPPIPLENASGNYVVLDLDRGRFAFYEHLKHRTIVVKPGERVKAGQVIGKLGYSGSSSIGPHLHFHLSDANSPLGAEGLPFVFTAFQQLGAFPSIDALMSGATFLANPAPPANPRMLERPAPYAVIAFR